MTKNKITIELTDDLAEALAQFCKRVNFSDIRDLAASDYEAFQMIEAFEFIKAELKKAGFNPS